ncbi:sulfite exporter TauE/SafE family protein [Actinidia rufa]|uniref:Sulfite exporter TauE/SafE family protein n=1 Tax=Actinidia rufa TaxID=165716 RepID=A0A7J0EJJ1_9ERIC|nr:sulfite exporter TauE/SafE family protein [Actinidia rufa]
MAVAATAACLVCWGLFTVIGFGSAERLLRVTEPDLFRRERNEARIYSQTPSFLLANWKIWILRLSCHNLEHTYMYVSYCISVPHPRTRKIRYEMEFGWRVVVGSIIGFFGAALGSIGGVGGGGIFVPMLTLIIGFDPKSSTAISKCMIMGAAGSTVYYNLRLRHPTLDMPVIDYDLALLFQPMLMLGISIGVAFNVIFADWMVTVLLIILFLDGSGEEYKPLPTGPAALADEEVRPLYNVYWKELALLVFRLDRNPCSSSHEGANCSFSGIVGGLLGLGGGFILGPLFLELGIPPQVASATSTFAMAFSSSMSVVQYYLLKRFPVPYASYFVLVATIAAFTGQHVVRKVIALLGRASIIIFILALTIFVSAISLGGVGIANMIAKLENQEYMGFENLCNQI